MKEELELRIGNVMENNNDLEAQVAIHNQTVTDKNLQITSLTEELIEVQEKYDQEKRLHKETQDILANINIRIERLQKRVNLLENANLQKLEEIDSLMDDAQYAKDELAKLYATYNFHTIDRSTETLNSYATWANKLMPQLDRVSGILPRHLSCSLCSNIPADLILMLPCEHIFCKTCFDIQSNTSKCMFCGKFSKNYFQSTLLIEIIDSLEVIS